MFGVADSEGALLENNSCSCCGANNEYAESNESGVAVAGLGRILAYIGNDGAADENCNRAEVPEGENSVTVFVNAVGVVPLVACYIFVNTCSDIIAVVQLKLYLDGCAFGNFALIADVEKCADLVIAGDIGDALEKLFISCLKSCLLFCAESISVLVMSDDNLACDVFAVCFGRDKPDFPCIGAGHKISCGNADYGECGEQCQREDCCDDSFHFGSTFLKKFVLYFGILSFRVPADRKQQIALIAVARKAGGKDA